MDEPMIGTLLDSYNQNNRFKLFPYYTVCFGGFPSSLKIVLPIEGSKTVIDSILQEIDFEKYHFTLVFKHWFTDDSQNAKMEEDYAYEYVFKSEEGQMLIHFISQFRAIQIQFLYHHENAAAEEWILNTNHKLRTKYGSKKMPKFKVLVSGEGGFYTEDVNTGDFQSVDIHELYNDDFAEINQLITLSMSRKESGIILLHGEPGTGKTTYIKNLISRFKDKDFIFIQNDFVRDLLKPSFVSFLLQNKDSVLIIEDAEKVVVSRDNHADASVVSTILQLTDGLFSDFLNIKVICTFNTDIDRIDKALLRKGRMIARYNFGKLSPEKTAALVKKLGYTEIPTVGLTLADIFGYDKRDFKEGEKKEIGFRM